jgi:hypothetical protein
MATKTLILAQLLISMLMAFCMSGIMGMIALGPSELWLSTWPKSFLIAWPIAFLLSIPIGRLSFAVAGKISGTPKIA